MKNLLFIFLFSLALAGCSGNDNINEQASNGKNEKMEQTEKEIIRKDVYVPNPQVPDDLNLVEEGKNVLDAKGELTLKAYKQVNETIKVGPMELKIKDVKVMHLTPDYSMIDFFRAFTLDEEFDFIKVAVEVKNTSSDKVNFSPIAFLQMNSGEQKTWEDDFYLEELKGEWEGSAVKRGSLGFVIKQAKPEDFQWVEFLTSDAVDVNGKTIEQAKKIKIVF